MRVARLLKYSAYGVILLGVYGDFKFFGHEPVKFWSIIFLTWILWCFLRVIANIGQIFFDIRSELSRGLGNIERSSYRVNATLKELKDLADSKKEK